MVQPDATHGPKLETHTSKPSVNNILVSNGEVSIQNVYYMRRKFNEMK